MTTGPIDWRKIDTVLLDMDGTLLDLRYDNWFWQELIPIRFAKARGWSTTAARSHLAPLFDARRGTIAWYCIDHWSRELGLDIAAIKRATLRRVRYLADAEQFLVRLRATSTRRILVTNAHPMTLRLKDQQLGLIAHFDAHYSTHTFGAPKEDANFWPRLRAAEGFDAERTLLVDDSLPVLRAAQGFGIGWLCGIRIPDSGRPPQDIAPYPAVDRVAQLLD